MLRLYRSFVDRRGSPDLPEHERTSGRGSIPAAEWVQEYIQGHRNFFQDLDEAAEHLAKTLDGTAGDLANALRDRLSQRHRINVRVVPPDVLDDALRHYDYHRRRLMLSELLRPPGRV